VTILRFRPAFVAALGLATLAGARAEHRSLPREPVAIGTEPQFFVDDYLVDNRWAIQYGNASREMVERVFHAPKKHPRNPLYAPPLREPVTAPQQAPSWFSVVRDADTG